MAGMSFLLFLKKEEKKKRHSGLEKHARAIQRAYCHTTSSMHWPARLLLKGVAFVRYRELPFCLVVTDASAGSSEVRKG